MFIHLNNYSFSLTKYIAISVVRLSQHSLAYLRFHSMDWFIFSLSLSYRIQSKIGFSNVDFAFNFIWSSCRFAFHMCRRLNRVNVKHKMRILRTTTSIYLVYNEIPGIKTERARNRKREEERLLYTINMNINHSIKLNSHLYAYRDPRCVA